jgi:PiT family inorganic phosphate transporter
MPSLLHSGGLLLIFIIIAALVFDYINGFHDTANAIATVISTRVLTPRAAILMAASFNLWGAFCSTKVAQMISSGLVQKEFATQQVILAAILGGIVWNLITWRYGIPSSSSHALVGGLVGAVLAHGCYLHRELFVHAGSWKVVLDVVIWKGVIDKVVIPLVCSPLLGFVLGLSIMSLLLAIFGRMRPGRVSSIFRKLQPFSSGWMAWNHGMNDAQKSMGIITMALISSHVIPIGSAPPFPVICACAVAMALGTSAGGYRIMRTMGQKIIRLEPINGFAAEAAAGLTIFLNSGQQMQASTTHVISGSIFGVGTCKRFSAVRWGVAFSMLAAWVLTIPCAGAVGAIFSLLLENVK